MSATIAAVHKTNAAELRTPARWWSYVRRGRVFCPRGHRVENFFQVTESESGLLRCNKQLGPGQDCDANMFLYAIRGGGIIVVELRYEDLKALKGFTTPAEALEYLNIFP